MFLIMRAVLMMSIMTIVFMLLNLRGILKFLYSYTVLVDHGSAQIGTEEQADPDQQSHEPAQPLPHGGGQPTAAQVSDQGQ